MPKLTNYTLGMRGINTVAGVVWIDAGKSADIATKDIIGELPDLGKKPEMIQDDDRSALIAKIEELEAEIAELKAAKASPLDHDQNGEPGGSKPKDPPALTGKNKAELLAIAADEKVTIEDNATNADIVSAIELAREEAAKA